MGENIAHEAKKLYLEMAQNDVGVTESATALEIKYALRGTEFRRPVEPVLRSMVGHGLVEERREVVNSRNSTAEEMRLIRSYQIAPNSLERLLR